MSKSPLSPPEFLQEVDTLPEAPPPLFHDLVDACLTVHRRLGPDCPHEIYLESLTRELKDSGISVKSGRAAAGALRNPSAAAGALRSEASSQFDLVIESCFPVMMISSQDESDSVFASPGRQLATFKEGIRTQGYEMGLMVDFDQFDLSEGLWLVETEAFSRSAATGAGIN